MAKNEPDQESAEASPAEDAEEVKQDPGSPESSGETETGQAAASDGDVDCEAEEVARDEDVPAAHPRTSPAKEQNSAPVPAQGNEGPISRILDLELPVSVTFGSTLRPLSDVLELKAGMVLELDTEAEDGAVLKVNQKTFARGEIVEVGGHYGLRITEIESKSQRLSALEGNG